MSEPSWLRRNTVEALEPLGALWGVSTVARGPGGFLRHWYGTTNAKLDPHWRAKRNAFLARHLAQIRARKEPLWVETSAGRFPSPRHLALVFWAHSPDPQGISNFLRRWKGEVPARPRGRR